MFLKFCLQPVCFEPFSLHFEFGFDFVWPHTFFLLPEISQSVFYVAVLLLGFGTALKPRCESRHASPVATSLKDRTQESSQHYEQAWILHLA